MNARLLTAGAAVVLGPGLLRADSCTMKVGGSDRMRIVHASTDRASASRPRRPSMARAYAWPNHDGDDIHTTHADGIGRRPLRTPGDDAEATAGPNDRIVFTRLRKP